jgi:hypothetical protein
VKLLEWESVLPEPVVLTVFLRLDLCCCTLDFDCYCFLEWCLARLLYKIKQ